jgi:DNA polymerase-3 subunit gamma/tau
MKSICCRASFNALLKTLEEPPAHVKFLLATTDPQKLPVTIFPAACSSISRRWTSNRSAISWSIFSAKSRLLLNRALQLLSRAADGSLRDALSLTDQAIASGDGRLTANREHHARHP